MDPNANDLTALNGLSPADTAALLELARLSPEDMAAVLAAIPGGGGVDIEALLGLDLGAFDAMGAGASAGPSGMGVNVGAASSWPTVPMPAPAASASASASASATATSASTSSSTSAFASASAAAGARGAPASSFSGAAAAGTATGAAASARPDLVRLADLVTHASLMLNQPAPDGPRKYTRSRRGCLTCRARKVKCDEVRPKCLRCAAMGRECTWDEEKTDKGKKGRKKAAPTAAAAAAVAPASAAAPAAAAPSAPALAPPRPGPSAAEVVAAVPSVAPSKRPLVAPASADAQALNPFRRTVPPTILPPAATTAAIPNVSFLPSAVPPIPSGAPTPNTPSADALAAAGLPPSLAKALAELAHPNRSSGSSSSSPANFDASSPWSQGRRPSVTTFPPLPPFKPTPPGSGEPSAKRTRANDGSAVASELAGLPFDFQSWVANVELGSPTSSTTQPRSGSDTAEEVIELARSTPDAHGRIQLEPAQSPMPILVDEEYAQAGDINLSLKGKLARRRLSDLVAQNGKGGASASSSASASASGSGTASGSSSGSSADLRLTTSPATGAANAKPTHPPLHTSVSNLIRLATQAHPTRELDPFMHAFPTTATRNLFQHYVDSTAGIVTAMGRSKPRENPFLQVSLPLVLGDTSTPGCAALRFALLTTSAAHIFHLRGGEEAADMCDRLKKLAIGYTVISQSEIEKERALAVTNGEDAGKQVATMSPRAERDNDMVLAACVVLVTRDVLSADPTWKANLEFALSSIRRRGGPEALMEADPSSFMRRFVLEQLATHEVFSCFTTGGEPTLLLPHARWWFDIEKSSTSDWEWESVENQFGISRKMVEVVSRICGLCARKNRLGPTASLDDPDLAPVAEHLRSEAEGLIAELESIAVSLRSLPLQRRVQYGDHIYRMSMSLHLMTEILCLPASHPRIRTIVPAALELCSEISSQPVMLVWPLLIIARVATPEERGWVSGLAGSYSDQYCRDLQIAEEVMKEMWKRIDEGCDVRTWHGLMAELDREVLLI